METIQSYWYEARGLGKGNVGDTLTPVIVEHFTGKKVELVDQSTSGKLVAIGSIMKSVKRNDVIWGAGIMRQNDKFYRINNCKFLAVRGKMTEKILGIKCGVYGDPALLLPLLYQPNAVSLKNEKN